MSAYRRERESDRLSWRINNPLCDHLTRCDLYSEAMERDASIVESLTHRRSRSVVKPNILN